MQPESGNPLLWPSHRSDLFFYRHLFLTKTQSFNSPILPQQGHGIKKSIDEFLVFFYTTLIENRGCFLVSFYIRFRGFKETSDMTNQVMGINSELFSQFLTSPHHFDAVLYSPIAILEFLAMILTIAYICKLLFQSSERASDTYSPSESSVNHSSLLYFPFKASSPFRAPSRSTRSLENRFDVGKLISIPKRSLRIRANR